MTRLDHEYLPHSSGCFLCGDENPCGAHTRFFVEGDTVRTRLTLPQHLNGYKLIAHGGVLAGLLDETMGWAATVFQPTASFFCHRGTDHKISAPGSCGRRNRDRRPYAEGWRANRLLSGRTDL